MKKLMYCLFICVKKITQTPNKAYIWLLNFTTILIVRELSLVFI